ncbi:DUF2000 family protein [Blautia sp. HCP3S3_D9]|uniref:DUF2000 family protein n=1 Tax=Blautia sp. HCP3S3_D9 TaxID=3438912 RepID=UPI003F891148
MNRKNLLPEKSRSRFDVHFQKNGKRVRSTLQYFGLAIYDPKKKVNKLTGSMPLLR